MKKFWLNHYPKQVPAEIGPIPYSSLGDFFIQTCETYAQKPALNFFDHTISYQQLSQLAQQFAAYLQHELKLEKGDRLGIMLPNCPQYYVAMFGALLAGLTVVNINPMYTTREFCIQAEDAGIKALVVLANFAHTIAEAAPVNTLSHLITTEVADLLPRFKKFIINSMIKYVKRAIPAYHLPQAITWPQLMSKAKKLSFTPVTVMQNDLAFLQYTGGTTGIPKGAMLTHGNILANIEQSYLWAASVLKPGEEKIIVALPLYHIFALTISCFIFFKVGGEAILIVNARDFKQTIHVMKKHLFTAFVGVNTLFRALLNQPHLQQVNFSALKLCLAGGMALQNYVAEKWRALTKCHIVQGYGLTETSPIVAACPIDLQDCNESIGMPLPSTDICIVAENNQEVGINEIGELCVKGPQVMKGYWRKPLETQEIFYHNEWLRTGDLVKIDINGFLYVVDRKKDMILVSGFNVYPNEIENVLDEHPDILEAGVIGVPDEKSGEAVKAFIVKKNPLLTEENVHEYCKFNLTGYKRPKYIEFVDKLPKSPVGKILHRELRK
jgi:long-chain acyl-CoA synthetase